MSNRRLVFGIPVQIVEAACERFLLDEDAFKQALAFCAAHQPQQDRPALLELLPYAAVVGAARRKAQRAAPGARRRAPEGGMKTKSVFSVRELVVLMAICALLYGANAARDHYKAHRLKATVQAALVQAAKQIDARGERCL
jgi:hypothetical protein